MLSNLEFYFIPTEKCNKKYDKILEAAMTLALSKNCQICCQRAEFSNLEQHNYILMEQLKN